MAKIADIATGDTTKLIEQNEIQKRMERMNMIRKVKQGRKLVGTALDMAGVKFLSQGLSDARSFMNKDGVYEVWASYGFITCEYDPFLAFQRVGLAYGKFEYVNITVRPGLPMDVLDMIDSILDLVIENKMSSNDLARKVSEIAGTGESLIFEVWGIL